MIVELEDACQVMVPRMAMERKMDQKDLSLTITAATSLNLLSVTLFARERQIGSNL